MLDPESIPRLMTAGTIEVAPLAYMRGRTLNDAFIILDEAQNTSPEQMKMFLTRLGFGSKMVVTGDVTQVDLPSGTRSGLRVVQDILEGIKDIALLPATAHDVVRHKLVGRIVAAYENFDPRTRRSSASPTRPPVEAATPLTSDRVRASRSRGPRRTRRGSPSSRWHPRPDARAPRRPSCRSGWSTSDTMAELQRAWMDEHGPDRRAVVPDGRAAPAAEDDEDPPRGILGDIVLCPAVAAAQARDGRSRHRATSCELLTIHGILHLLGYDHAEPEEKRGDVRRSRRGCWRHGGVPSGGLTASR